MLGLLQVRPRAVAHVVDQVELVFDAIVPNLGSHLAEGSHARVRRVVDDDVDAAHTLGALGDPLLHGFVIGQVAVVTVSLVALSAKLFGIRRGNALGTAGAAYDGALGAQKLLRHMAHALRGAREQDFLALQALADRLFGRDPLAEFGSTGNLRSLNLLCHEFPLSLARAPHAHGKPYSQAHICALRSLRE